MKPCSGPAEETNRTSGIPCAVTYSESPDLNVANIAVGSSGYGIAARAIETINAAGSKSLRMYGNAFMRGGDLVTSDVSRQRHISLPNVPRQESPLASGMAPAREAESAGDMTEVPKGRGFAGRACSALFLSLRIRVNCKAI